MFKNILEKHKNSITGERQGAVTMKSLKGWLVATVIAVCLITTTVFASIYMGLDVKFLNFLKPLNSEQEEYLANGAYIINKQVKNKNGTLKIKQAIGDSNVTLILMDFIAPEGIVLDKEHYSFENMGVDAKNYGSYYGYGIISLKDDNSDDNKISMVMRVKTKDSLMGQKFHIKLKDLQGADTLPGEFTTTVSGEWEARFKLDFENYSTDYQLDKNIEINGYEANLKTISVSPISITLKVESQFTKEIHEATHKWEELAVNEYSDDYSITINYKDGSSETTNKFNGMHHLDHLSGEMLFTKTFDSVINDKEISSVIFFDTKVPISK